MTLMIVALGAPQMSDPKAEEAFRRIEERLRTSKTLALSFRSSLGSLTEEATLRMQGSLHWAGEGRMRYDVRLSSKHSSMEYPILAVTDGAVTRVKWPTSHRIQAAKPEEVWRGRTVSELRTSPEFREHMVRQLAAFGLSGPAMPRRDDHLSLTEDRPSWCTSAYDLPWNRVQAGAFRGPSVEEGVEALTFKVKVEGLEPRYQVKLWYDPKTLRLVRRTLELPTCPSLVLTEIYDEWGLDVDVPAEKFTLPLKKE